MIVTALVWGFVGFLISKAIISRIQGEKDEDYNARYIAGLVEEDLDVETEIRAIYPEISRGLLAELNRKADNLMDEG